MEVEEERRRREGERGGLNLFYVWTYCAIHQWPDPSNVCLDRSVQYNIGHIWPIGQISPMEAINYNFPKIYSLFDNKERIFEGHFYFYSKKTF